MTFNIKTNNITHPTTQTGVNQQLGTQQNQSNELKTFEGEYVGTMPLNSGTTKEGKPWTRVLIKFKGHHFDKEFRPFVPLKAKNTLQVEQLVQGKNYKVGYKTNTYTRDDGQLGKSNSVIFINEGKNVSQPVQNQAFNPQPVNKQVDKYSKEEIDYLEAYLHDQTTVNNKPAWVEYFVRTAWNGEYDFGVMRAESIWDGEVVTQ